MIRTYTKLQDLTESVTAHQQFQDDVKNKRIKKELISLDNYHEDNLAFKQYEISESGVSLYIEIKDKGQLFDFQIVIDYDYPFTPPKIYYQSENSAYSNCLDLFPTIIQGRNWNPSLKITSLMDKMPNLVKNISEQSDAIKGTYHIYEIYEKTLLQKYGVTLFNVDEYQWKYMIKSISKRVLGLTKSTLLRFALQGSKLRLISSTNIKDITEANAIVKNGNFKLDIISNTSQGIKKFFFVGEEKDIQKILYFMNPVQVTERRLASLQKDNYKPEQIQQIIEQYTQLIEYYSLHNQEKSKQYVDIVHTLIKKSYQIKQ